MKFPAILLLAFSMACASGHATESVYELKHTVNYKDGTKSEGAAIFSPIDGVLVPIDLGMAGLCVLQFLPENAKTAPPTHGTFRVRTTLGSTGPEMKMLFESYLPISMGKEMRLFKSLDLSLTVQISEVPAEK